MKFTREDGRFTLESMSGQKITVTQTELSQLVLLSKNYLDQVQRTSPDKLAAIATVPATRAIVSIDMHHTKIFLRLYDPSGFEQAFELSDALVTGIIEGLTKQANFIAQAAAERGRSN